MAFRLERDESLRDGIRRVAREEIKAASAVLSGRHKISQDEAIHEARKSIKKTRAILRLMRRKPHDPWARENGRLRDIARRLSEFRDSAAIIETFDGLRKRYRGKAGVDRLYTVRAALGRQLRETHATGGIADVLRKVVEALDRTHHRTKAWTFPREGYEALGEGLRRTYRGGREALAEAQKDRTADNFHELRKRVKDHWYHVRLLEALWSDVMEAREKTLKDLETGLGEDHNLFVLRERISARPSSFGKEEEVDLTLRLIHDYQTELREKAVPLAERIYQEKPAEFAHNLQQLWKTWKADPGPAPHSHLKEAPGPPKKRPVGKAKKASARRSVKSA